MSINDDRQVLFDTLKFHGHRCWASVAGARAWPRCAY